MEFSKILYNFNEIFEIFHKNKFNEKSTENANSIKFHAKIHDYIFIWNFGCNDHLINISLNKLTIIAIKYELTTPTTEWRKIPQVN